MSKTALLMIDLQNDYFPDGKWELEGTEAVAIKAADLLSAFREQKLPIVHVRHEFPTSDAPFFAPATEGSEIHTTVQPIEGEPVVLKHQINSFRETNLKEVLDGEGVETVLICGAMSHMCVDAVTRAANDLVINAQSPMMLVLRTNSNSTAQLSLPIWFTPPLWRRLSLATPESQRQMNC